LVKIGVLELIGYREWTESIGFDREHIIQLNQSKLYYELQSIISEAGGFIIPLRYDYMIIIANGVEDKTLMKLPTIIKYFSPVPIRIAVSCAKTPYEAQLKATLLLPEAKENTSIIDHNEYCNDHIVVAQFDINYYTLKTRYMSVYDTYLESMQLYLEVVNLSKKIGGITSYLGGDNVLLFLSLDKINILYDLARKDLKIGVGVSKVTRRAITLSAKALDSLRMNRKEKNNKGIKIIYDE